MPIRDGHHAQSLFTKKGSGYTDNPTQAFLTDTLTDIVSL